LIVGIIIRGKVFIDFLLRLFRIKSVNGKVKGDNVEVDTNGKFNLDDKLKSIDSTLSRQEKTIDKILSKVTTLSTDVTELAGDHKKLREDRGQYEAGMKATVEGVKDLVANELGDLRDDEKKTASNVERLIEKTVELTAEVKARRP